MDRDIGIDIKTAIKEQLSFAALLKELHPNCWSENGNSHCPFHDDERASFQISEDHGYCHAGCAPEGGSKSWDIFSLYMKARGTSFDDALVELGERCGITMLAKRESSGKPRRSLVETYDYLDEAGRPPFGIFRYEPKDFGQYPSNGKGCYD